MFVTLIIVMVVTLLLMLLRFFRHKEIDLSHIPGPSFNPWLQLFRKPDTESTHTMLRELARQYGPVMKIPELGTDVLVVSGFTEIYQVYVKEGLAFGGRPTSFRLTNSFGETGILHNLAPDTKWKALRKITQQHLRQFSDGMSRIQDIILEITNTMVREVERNVGKPYDPNDIICDAAFINIAILIVGQRPESSDPILKKMHELSDILLQMMSNANTKVAIMDIFPWLQYFRWPAMKVFERFNELERAIWENTKDFAKENPEAHSICSAFDGHSGFDERDVMKTSLLLQFAGVVTTSSTFYGLINMLAHNKEVQANICNEIENVREETSREVSLQDRKKMSYSYAVILEALRLGTVAPVGVWHRSLKDMHLGGYKIPANTTIISSFWTLHHDEEFWDEPYSFKPDRFLDDQGEVVPADHPNRKHLMAFGAGTRVCVGELLAMARLFLWMVNLVQRFEISPAPGNNEDSIDPRGYKFCQSLKPRHYKVIFTERK